MSLPLVDTPSEVPSPIRLAVRSGQLKSVTFMLEHSNDYQVDLSDRTEAGDTLLHEALRLGNWKVATFLTQTMPRKLINSQNSAGQTPLHEYCIRIAEHPEEAINKAAYRTLMDHEADPSIENDAGYIPACYVLRSPHLYSAHYQARDFQDIAAEICGHPSTLSFQTPKSGSSLLLYSFRQWQKHEGSARTVRSVWESFALRLVDAGHDPNHKGLSERTLLHLVFRSSLKNHPYQLMRISFDCWLETDDQGKSPLELAVSESSANSMVFQKIIPKALKSIARNRDGDCNHQFSDGSTLLHQLVQVKSPFSRDQMHCIQETVRKGVSIHTEDANGLNATSLAYSCGQKKIYRWLRQQGGILQDKVKPKSLQARLCHPCHLPMLLFSSEPPLNKETK